MLGELFNAMADELFETDENKAIAGLPYMAAKAQTGLNMLASVLTLG